MKRFSIVLLLFLLLLCGCTRVNDAATSTSGTTPALPTNTQTVSDTAVPKPTDGPGTLHGVEMELPEDLTATPGCPWVTVTVSFPKVELYGGAEERTCSLTLTLDGETVGEWPALELQPGLEEQKELEFSFNRYQPDRTAVLVATLRRGEQTLVRETSIAVNNYPEEVYQALTCDDRPYSIDVLRNENVVIVYGRDDEDAYTIPVQVWLCSTGSGTPTGNYQLGAKHEWWPLFGGVYGQYVSGITGDILFHSVPYERMEKDSLESEEFNKLGTTASMGCVRLAVKDVKWIFDNCPSGTPVHIYDAEQLPVERPAALKIDLADPRAGWDPTDPDPGNPWNS